jgi:hypothetical protein
MFKVHGRKFLDVRYSVGIRVRVGGCRCPLFKRQICIKLGVLASFCFVCYFGVVLESCQVELCNQVP